jgi:glycerol-3-phosphate dehydrogenase
LAHLPTLSTDHLVAGFLYFDARADDARLTLAVARTAAFEFGAVVANYTPVVRLTTGADGTANGAVVRPVPDDETSEFPIRARIVVNASGVWADAVRALDEGRDPHAIRPAKGIHITVPASRLPCDIAAVIPVHKDKRSIFVVSSISAPPTRTTPVRSTILPVRPRMSTTSWTPPTPSPRRTSPGPT